MLLRNVYRNFACGSRYALRILIAVIAALSVWDVRNLTSLQQKARHIDTRLTIFEDD